MIGPRPAQGDLAIAKTRYSAFFGTDLDARLKAKGKDTVVVCGLTTDCCVDCLLIDSCAPRASIAVGFSSVS